MPLWYGFWIQSPLVRAHAEVLHPLLDAVFAADDPHHHQMAHFLEALKAVIAWQLPLRVSLAPPCHVD